MFSNLLSTDGQFPLVELLAIALLMWAATEWVGKLSLSGSAQVGKGG